MGHKVHPTGFRLGVPEAGISMVEIDRQANNVSITIHTARPGILIGRGGQRVDEMRTRLEGLIGKRVQLNIREVPQPELDAQLVARNVCDQLERRIAYRRTLKQSLLRTMQAGARGMRISIAGRLDGAEIARRVTMHEGQVPLHTLRADIDYGFSEARTNMGRVGVKVWLYKGDILPEAREEELEEAIQEPAEPVAEAAVEEKPAEPVAETAVEAEPAEPVAEAVVEEAPAEPVVETAVEEEPAEPVAEAVVEEEPAEPVVEAVVEEEPAEPVVEAAVEEEPAEPVVEAAVEETAAEAEVEEPGETVVEAVEESESTSEVPENQGESDATT